MATECTREAIRGFITERGGRVKHVELIQHFKPAFPDDPAQKTAAREMFKAHVDSMAFVKLDNGVKFVCLKKTQYRGPVRCDADAPDDPVRVCPGGDDDPPLTGDNDPPLTGDNDPPLTGDNDAPPPEETLSVRHGAAAALQPSSGEWPRASMSPGAAGCAAETARGSGYGNDCQVNPPTVPLMHIPSEGTLEGDAPVLPCTPAAAEALSNGEIEMGNRWGSNRKKSVSIERCTPVDAASGSSPLPAFSDDDSVFVTPGREPNQPAQSGLVPSDATQTRDDGNRSVARADDSLETRAHGGTRPRIQWDLPSDDEGHEGGDEGPSEGEDSPVTPRASRQAFIGLMMDRSPQVRRSMMFRNAPGIGGGGGDDTASLASSGAGGEEDAHFVALDPLEHEWMLCASDGEWDSLRRLLSGEPALLLKKDFVTGFTCLHWAAKQGKPELLALVANFAQLHGVPLDVNSRSSAGYTPLHLAAMHGHGEVVKLLVGAYDADVEARDYSGRKAGQYLSAAARDLRDIIEEAGGGDKVNGGGFCDADEPGGGRGWRFSKVLQPLRLLGPNEGGGGGGGGDQGPRQKPLRRMSSLSRVKPRLQKLRDRTSQMVHSASFREMGELGAGHTRTRHKSGLTPADLVTLRGGDAD